MRRALANLALLLASCAVALALGEAIARRALPDDRQVEATANQYRFYRFDPRLGWANAALRHGEFRRQEFAYPVRINAHGMRYREVDRAPSGKGTRVAVLGDSFAWGIGAAEAERFTERVERATGGAFELLNFGVSGYGPVQHLLVLDEVLAFRPRAVVLSFCLGNDFADNVLWRRYGYYKPFVAEVAPGAPRVEGYPLPNVREFIVSETSGAGAWLDERSRLYRAARAALRAKAGAPVAEDPGQRGLVGFEENQRDLYFPERATPEARALATRAVAVNAAILGAIADRLRREGVAFAVVLAPTKCEYGACFPGEPAPNPRARDHLLATLGRLGIDAIDPTGEMTLADFWAVDGHWRPSGHDKVAARVQAWLERLPAR